jgi:hypothetical protein
VPKGLPMSGSHFHTVLTVALLLPISAVPFASTVRQDVHRDSASVTINPTEATGEAVSADEPECFVILSEAQDLCSLPAASLCQQVA